MAWLARHGKPARRLKRKGSLMMDDDRISAALPEGIETKPARRSDGEGGQEPRKRAAVSAGQAG